MNKKNLFVLFFIKNKKIFLRSISFFVSLCLFLLACSISTEQEKRASTKKWKITFVSQKTNKSSTVFCETAITDKEKSLGLMYRKSMQEDDCMIFVYKEPQILHFWMANTYVPLSIAFINNAGVISSIHDMQPLDKNHTISKEKVIYAIETKQSWFQKNGILPNDRVKIEGM